MSQQSITNICQIRFKENQKVVKQHKIDDYKRFDKCQKMVRYHKIGIDNDFIWVRRMK